MSRLALAGAGPTAASAVILPLLLHLVDGVRDSLHWERPQTFVSALTRFGVWPRAGGAATIK